MNGDTRKNISDIKSNIIRGNNRSNSFIQPLLPTAVIKRDNPREIIVDKLEGRQLNRQTVERSDDYDCSKEDDVSDSNESEISLQMGLGNENIIIQRDGSCDVSVDCTSTDESALLSKRKTPSAVSNYSSKHSESRYINKQATSASSSSSSNDNDNLQSRFKSQSDDEVTISVVAPTYAYPDKQYNPTKKNMNHEQYRGTNNFMAMISPANQLTTQSGSRGVLFTMKRISNVVNLQWEKFQVALGAGGVSTLNVCQTISNLPPFSLSFPIVASYKGKQRISYVTIDPSDTMSSIKFSLFADGSSDSSYSDLVNVLGSCITWICEEEAIDDE